MKPTKMNAHPPIAMPIAVLFVPVDGGRGQTRGSLANIAGGVWSGTGNAGGTGCVGSSMRFP